MTAIPNDWAVSLDGDWDLTITRDTSPAWSGGSSIGFYCPGGNVDLQMVGSKFAVYPGQPICVSSWFRADSTAADDWTYNGIDWLNAAEAVFQEDRNNAHPNTVDTWEELAHVFTAPAGAAWAQLIFGQVSDNPASQFVSHVGTCEATPMPRCARLRRTTNWTLDGLQNNRIPFDAWDYNYGGFTWDSSTRQVAVPSTGIYACDAWGYSVTPNNNGTDWTGSFYVNGTLVEQSPVFGSIVGAGGANRVRLPMVRLLNRGDMVGFTAINNGTGALAVQATALPAAEFSIFKLGE